jgi:hypothetical protein
MLRLLVAAGEQQYRREKFFRGNTFCIAFRGSGLQFGSALLAAPSSF